MKFLPFLTRKSVFLILPIILVGSYALHEAAAYSYGITGQSRVGCGGYGCHGLQSSNTVISISTSSPQIVAGQTYIFRISVANPIEYAAGCDISADNGAKLKPDSAGLWSEYSSELTHSAPNPFGRAYGKSGDSAVWLFQYTAPSKVGTAHIYTAGNAVNFNGVQDAGDHWNLAVDTLSIVAAGVATDGNGPSSVRIFPNPSAGRFTLYTPGMTGRSDIVVSNVAGNIVFHSSMILGRDQSLDLSRLPNGIYLISIRARGGESYAQRVVLER